MCVDKIYSLEHLVALGSHVEVAEFDEELDTSKYSGILARGIVEGADERTVGEKSQLHSSSDKLKETYANVSATDHMRGIIAKALARLELSVSCKGSVLLILLTESAYIHLRHDALRHSCEPVNNYAAPQ